MEQHITVLKNAAIEALALRPNSIVVDATLGSGGHSAAILEKLNTGGVLIALDTDSTAIDAAKGLLKGKATIHLVHRNFRELGMVLDELDIEHVDAVLADLGWRIEQFTSGGKGFSFQVDEPLLMTYGDPDDYAFTARDIVNDWREEDIVNVIKAYGEERFARRIARAIAVARESAPIETSLQLAHIIGSAVPAVRRMGKVHPATRTFQALRIAVNDELDTLRSFIEVAVARLSQGGRLAIITFHSLEDRIVKHTFRELSAAGTGRIITKKPITPTDDELAKNPRARSAKLRIFEKT